MKKLKYGFLVQMVCSMLTFSCIEYIEAQSSTMGDHYGQLTIKNSSSSPITQITIREGRHIFFEDSNIISDTTQIPPGSSRTYGKEYVQMKLELMPYDDFADLLRRVWVNYGGSAKIKFIYLSEGADVEVVATDNGLVVTNPIYENR
jgi:hypothetical protein